MGQLEDMRAFILIVEQGSISKAAQDQGVVKSSISRRLNDLETRLGIQLINRTTRKITLTEAGLTYYHQTKNILEQITEHDNQLSENSDELSGKIRISVPFSFGLKHLAPKIHEFAKQHSKLNIHIDFTDQLVDLIEHSYDLAIRISRLKDSSLKALKIAEMHGVIAASPDYLSQRPSIIEPNDLKLHDILHYQSTNSDIWTFQKHDEPPIKVNLTDQIKMRSNNGDFLKDASVAGLGISASPAFMIHEEIEQGKLIPILSDYTASKIAIYAVYPETKFLTKRVRHLMDYLKQSFAYPNLWD